VLKLPAAAWASSIVGSSVGIVAHLNVVDLERLDLGCRRSGTTIDRRDDSLAARDALYTDDRQR